MKTKSVICHLTFISTLHPLYLCHQNQCINCITPTFCKTLQTICMTSHQYAWHHMNTLSHHIHIGMTSHPVYFWHHIQYIWYHPYCFMKTKRLYLASHPLFWHHSHCICVVTSTPSVPSQQLWKASDLAHIWHHTHLRHIKFRLYEINSQYLGHHKHCIHDIKSPIYDITSTAYDIPSPIPVTSQPL